MRIKRLHTDGFGALRGSCEPHAGMNLIYAPNESGKTTLAAALLALIYGVKQYTGKRRLSTEDEKRYRPFTGEQFNVEGILQLEDGRELDVRRDFLKDQFRVIDVRSGEDKSSEFSAPPNGDKLGEKLLELSREQFMKLANIRQDDAAGENDFHEFSEYIANIFGTEDGQGTAHAAMDLLEKSLLQYNGITGRGAIKIETEISRLDKEINEAEGKLSTFERELASREEELARNAHMGEECRRLEKNIRELEAMSAASRIRELEAFLKSANDATKKTAEIGKEVEELSYLEKFELNETETLALLHEKLTDSRTKEEQLRKTIIEMSAGAEVSRSKLQQYNEKSDFPENKRTQLEITLKEYTNASRAKNETERDMEKLSALLSARGIDEKEAQAAFASMQSLASGDRSFLAGYNEQENKTHHEIDDLEAGIAKQHEEIAGLDQQRDKTLTHSKILLAAGGALTLAGAATAAAFAFWMSFLSIIGLFVIGGGYLLRLRAQTMNAEKYAEGSLIVASLSGSIRNLTEEAQERDEKLAHLAESISKNKEDLLKESAIFAELQNSMPEWGVTRERLAQCRESLEKAKEKLAGLLGECGINLKPENITEESASALLREIDAAVSCRREIESLASSQKEKEDKSTKLREEISRDEKRLREILQRGGVNAQQEENAAIAEYRKRAEGSRRLRLLKEEKLPEIERLSASPQRIEGARHELESIKARLETIDDIDMERLVPEGAELLASSQYDAEREAISRRRDEMAREINRAEQEYTRETSGYHEEAPRLRERLEECRTAKARAERFGKAVEIAKSTLSGLAEDLHQRWSPALAGELEAMLQKFASDKRPRLSKDMALSLDVNGGGLLDGAGIRRHMSAGMRDQIYLCLRMLLAEKIGGGEKLPLILDDPFVNADDERMQSGLQMIMDRFAAGHQIFIFTCHQSRHEKLLETIPELAKSAWSLTSDNGSIPTLLH